MAMINIEGINLDRVKVAVKPADDGVMVVFSGDIDMEDPGIILDPFLDKVHRAVVEQKIKKVLVDLKQLNFLNSSGIKALAKWIMQLSSLGDAEKYHIVILHNKEITWQITSLPTLVFLVPGLIQVE